MQIDLGCKEDKIKPDGAHTANICLIPFHTPCSCFLNHIVNLNKVFN